MKFFTIELIELFFWWQKYKIFSQFLRIMITYNSLLVNPVDKLQREPNFSDVDFMFCLLE